MHRRALRLPPGRCAQGLRTIAALTQPAPAPLEGGAIEHAVRRVRGGGLALTPGNLSFSEEAFANRSVIRAHDRDGRRGEACKRLCKLCLHPRLGKTDQDKRPARLFSMNDDLTDRKRLKAVS